MTTGPAFALLAGLLVAGAACSNAASEEPVDPNAPVVVPVDAALIERGKALYLRNCAPCHGELGKGDGPASATLNPKPRDHSNREYMDTLADQRIADTVKMGGAAFGYPNMPSSPHIRGDDMAAVIAYVRSLSRGSDELAGLTLKPGF